MSRLKHFTHSLASGYLQIGVNVFYTLASIPLAFHYLSNDEFALWQIAVTVAGYLLLVDFGMTGSAARILIDHKDNPESGAYGSVIKISALVFLIQGALIVAGGTILSFWLPQLMNVQPEFQRPLFFLVAGQCALQGIFFAGRIFSNLGVAHQRYDLYNYTQIGALVVQFTALWLSFHEGAGIYSVLIASAAGLLFGFCGGWRLALRFHFFPPRGCWGKFDFTLFREIFFFGGNQFLMAVGAQLTSASQILIIGHTLGLGAAAAWSVAIKPFMFAQQFIGRIFAFACSALAEMIVRGEHDRFLRRFRDIVMLSVALSVFVAGGIALCNESFLQVWVKGRIAWNSRNDLLLALWFAISCATTMQVSMTTLTKQIGRMRYVYLCEGVLFVASAVFLAPHFGIPGIIIAAIAANILCSGVFGVRSTMKYFQIPAREIMAGWLARSAAYFALLLVIFTGCRILTESLPPIIRLTTNAAIAGVVGLWLLWRVGFNSKLRDEMRSLKNRAKARLPKIFGSPTTTTANRRDE